MRSDTTTTSGTANRRGDRTTATPAGLDHVTSAWTPRRLRVALGFLWVIAGLLQLQPFMFTKGLALQILAPAANLQPAPVRVPIVMLARLVLTHPAAFDTAFALAEIAIGLGLIGVTALRASRYVCGCAVAMALGIWWLGEGLGGIATGHAATAMGAPGAAALYALVALVAWPRPPGRPDADRPVPWIGAAWLVLWASTAFMTLLPGQRSPTGLSAQIAMGASMSPDVLARPEFTLADAAGRLSSTSALIVAGVLGLIQAAIAIGGLVRGRARRAAVVASIGFATVCWMLGQGFGGISTGQATDVGTGPVLVLLALALMASHHSRPTPVLVASRPLAAARAPQVISSNFSRTA